MSWYARSNRANHHVYIVYTHISSSYVLLYSCSHSLFARSLRVCRFFFFLLSLFLVVVASIIYSFPLCMTHKSVYNILFPSLFRPCIQISLWNFLCTSHVCWLSVYFSVPVFFFSSSFYFSYSLHSSLYLSLQFHSLASSFTVDIHSSAEHCCSYERRHL